MKNEKRKMKNEELWKKQHPETDAVLLN